MLARLTAFLLGLLAGAMLLIAVAVAPYWQTLPPLAFRGWFALHAWRIGRLMRPLGAGAVLVAGVAWLGARRSPDGRRVGSGVAALAALGVLLVTLVVNEPANQLFSQPGVLTDGATTALLARWIRWHWVRVGLGMLGFWAALRAVRSSG
ncbi:MAG TPA: anthrone oxygenase family protein [Candidatus Binatus sp.]|nr:anthrone oxygenase family protein [Candidatus Binatus sp.]